MAENTNKSFLRSTTGMRQSSGGNAASKGSTNMKTNNISKASKDLLSREEEYKRLNEELEAKTATLVHEAETIMGEIKKIINKKRLIILIKEQETLLSKPSLLDNINTEEFLGDWHEDEEKISGRDSKPPTSSRAGSSRRQSKVSNQSRPESKATNQNKAKKLPKIRAKNAKSNVADNVAVPDESFLTQFRDFSLEKTISNIEGKVEHGELTYDDEDIMPSAAADMGSEAQIRFLKAKLRVMQEELDRLSHECNKKDENSDLLLSKTKELEEERNRLQRTNASQQTQIEKYKRLAEDSKSKADSLENQLSGVRRDLQQMDRSQKQQASSQSATEVRLNRALEDLEKYKSQLQKAKSYSKERSDQEKRRADQLLAENKRLEKQKNELITGYKKQLKLIDVLKKQKMHIEAAQMLSFTEEEFMKALEWGS